MLAIGLWTSGVVLAGASAVRIHHAAATDADNEPPSWAAAAPKDTGEETAGTEGALVLPTDVIVGRRALRPGMVLMQKP